MAAAGADVGIHLGRSMNPGIVMWTPLVIYRGLGITICGLACSRGVSGRW